jgi:selenocysteine-specific elongation factor
MNRPPPLVLGTAGHIDHGKTSLVRALTGIDTDRLEVEKRRGITTELGFAHLDLGDQRLGVVDVPGHERFIKSMVAGAGGIDLVCLVVAADEGVMPQTREHLEICQLLGVARGVVALTKDDLVDDEWRRMVSGEIRELVAGGFLADAAIVPLTTRGTGAGLDALRAELARLCADLPARRSEGSFRLPLDRVFTVKGFGTVVTGTVLGGEVAVGDAIVVHPRGLEGKVRGIELHGAAVERARAGNRAALNLGGLAVDQLTRGDLLAHPGVVAPSHLLDARFRHLASAATPLPRRSRVLVHHAANQVLATMQLVDREQLAPGEDGLVQLRLDAATPLAALPGDRFVTRGFVATRHHGTTIGGGEIVRVRAPRLRRGAADAARALEALAAANRAQRIVLEIAAAGALGSSLAELVRRLGFGRAELEATLADAIARGEVVAAGEGDAAVYVAGEVVALLEAELLAALPDDRDDDATREAVRGKLPRAMPARLFDLLCDALVARGAIVAERDRLARARRAARPADPLDHELVERFRGWGRSPPRPTEVAGQLGRPEPAVMAALARLLAAGALIKVKPDLYVEAGALAELRAALIAHLERHGQIDPPGWKQLCGVSRKWAIPLAEHFDAERVTLRIGDLRKRRG